jgi:superfamily I DNA/RNA helicase
MDDTRGFVAYLRQKFKGLNFESEDSREVERIKEFQERDPHEYVALTSAHRSKGLEFERVYILEIDQFPSKMAETEKEKAQEYNALYVAFTRAIRQLNVLEPPPKEEEEKDSWGW